MCTEKCKETSVRVQRVRDIIEYTMSFILFRSREKRILNVREIP